VQYFSRIEFDSKIEDNKMSKKMTKDLMKKEIVTANIGTYSIVFISIIAMIFASDSILVLSICMLFLLLASLNSIYAWIKIKRWKKDPELNEMYGAIRAEGKQTRTDFKQSMNEVKQAVNKVKQVKSLTVKYDVGLEEYNLLGSYSLYTTELGLEINKIFGKDKILIPWAEITEVEAGSEADLRSRLTVSRVLLTGIFALGLKKERKKGFYVSVATQNSIGLFEINTSLRDNRANEKKARVFAAACNTKVRSLNPKQVSANKPSSSSNLEDINKLGDLLKKGLITKEEFDKKKKQILGI